MRVQEKISLMLSVILVIITLLPQAVFAESSNDNKDNGPAYYDLEKWGGAEMASENAIRIYWGDFSTAGGKYQISWRKNNTKKWESVDIDDPGTTSDEVKSFLISGLEAGQEYDVRICAILKNEKGEWTLTRPLALKGSTYVTAPEYLKPYSDRGNGEHIELTWAVREKNALLKIYRADTKNGKYKLIVSTDGRTDKNHSNYRDQMDRIVYCDETVKVGKAYYYKAVSELTLDDGRVIKAESPKSYRLTAKNRPFGSYTSKFMNKRGTYSKNLTWKMTSDKANYDTKLVKKDIGVLTRLSKTGEWIIKRPVNVQYSYNGKRYYNMKSAFTMKPGMTIYLRVNLKNKMWIRKDGIGSLHADILYCKSKKLQPQYTLELHMDDKMEVFDPEEGDHPGDDFYEDIDNGWENSYQLGHSSHDRAGSDLHGRINNEKNVVLTWKLCPYTEGYNIRYGSSEKEAQASEPIQIPKDQFAYEVKGLKENAPYYFFLSELCRDEKGRLYETARPYGQIRIREGGWKEDVTYGYYSGIDLSITVTEEKNVALDWNPCGDGYKIQYGTSKEEAEQCEPIIINDGNVHYYEIENPPKHLSYFFFTKLVKDESGKLVESGWIESNMFLGI